jgi:hypothetical protein
VSLNPNAVEPCGTPTAKRRHIALSEFCFACGTPGRLVPLPTLDELIAEFRRQREALDRGAA